MWLQLRDEDAVAEVRAQLADVDDALLLALPGLGSVQVDVDGDARTVSDVVDRWVVVTATGELDPALLAERPVEEREHRGWRLTWAVPRDGRSGVSAVVHAPTRTDDASTVPALLIGTFPLDPGRRRVTAGPVTDALVALAGELWPELAMACRRAREAAGPGDGDPTGGLAPDPLDLLPTGFPAGALDAALREVVLAATRSAAVLPTAHGWMAPADAVMLAPPWDATDAPRVLGRWFDHLAILPPTRREVARALGVAVVGLGELVEQLPASEPGRLREVYALLATSDGVGSADLDELGSAPVPLRDGRVVHGARGAVLVDDVPDSAAAALDTLVAWGLRVVHPDAAHPVLERLGAQRVDAAALTLNPMLRDRVLDGDEDAAAVLCDLVAAAPTVTGPSWWSEVLLPAADGEPVPARELVLPDSPAADWFDPDVLPCVDGAAVTRWGDALVRVGVRAGLVVEQVDELVADAIEDWPEYLAQTGAADDGELLAVADLDAVANWPAVLAALAGSGGSQGRRDVLAPVRDDDGRPIPSYVAWRLRREPALGGGRPFALPGADRGAGVMAHLPAVPPALAALASVGSADALLVAVGGVGAAENLSGGDWLALLDDLDERAEVPLGLAVDCWRALGRLAAWDDARADAGPDLADLADAAVLPGWDGRRAVALPAEELAAADPMWRRHPGVWPVLPTPFGSGLAEALDLEAAPERAAGRVAGDGEERAVPAGVLGLVPGVPATYRHHERLVVDGHELEWWVVRGVLHASRAGLAEGLAALAGWTHRHRFAAVLADPGAVAPALLDLAGEA